MAMAETHPLGTTVNAAEWTGPDDVDNPRNFSLARKIFSTVACTGLAFVSTLAASIISPGVDDVAGEFHVSREVALLPLALYSLGLAFGPLLGSPLSETSGRKAVVLATTPIFGLFTLGAGFSKSATSLIVCRILAGVFAAPAVGNAAATITDYTAGRYRAVVMNFYYAVPTFGALLGVLLGGFISQAKGWRWTQWTTCFFIVAFYIPVLFTKETYKKTILQRRAKALGTEYPTVQRTVAQSIHYFATILFLRPIHMLFTELIVSLVCLYCGFLYGLIYTFVVASPWVYEHYYAFSPSSQNLSFLGLILGTLLTPIPLQLLDYYVYRPHLARFTETREPGERFPPEHRLYPALLAAPLLPTFLLCFAWTARPFIHWAVPIVFQGLAMAMSVMIYASTNIFMMDAYGPLYGASAAGAAMLSRYTFSTVTPLYSLQMYRALGVGWATTLLALCTLLMAPIPWGFWRFGELVRKKGKYETAD